MTTATTSLEVWKTKSYGPEPSGNKRSLSLSMLVRAHSFLPPYLFLRLAFLAGADDMPVDAVL